jgi:putative membrane protein
MHRPGPASNFTQLIADARAKLAQNQVDEAIDALQGILKSAPANAEAAALLSDAQKQKRQKDVSVLMLEAQGQRSQNQFEESRKTLQKILELDPGNEPALAILSQLDAQESASKSSAEQDIEVKKWLANASAFIGAGKLAEAKASSAEVKAFGKQMVTDHSGVNKQAVALVTKLKVTPEDNATSKSLKAGGEDNTKNLHKLSGAAFDKAYVDHEVAYHEQVIDALDKTLIPSAQNAELKNLLMTVRPAFVAHLEHAKNLQASLAKKG